MKKIQVDLLSEGQVLARPIRSEDGKILLAEGATIGSSSKAVLRKWGVPLVYVQETDEDNSEGNQEELLEKAKNKRERLEKIFSEVKDEPLMRMIYDVVVKKLDKNNG